MTVARFHSSRSDLLCSPRITAGELKEEFNPSWEYKPCTTIPVFYSTRCEDWTAMEDTSQESF